MGLGFSRIVVEYLAIQPLLFAPKPLELLPFCAFCRNYFQTTALRNYIWFVTINQLLMSLPRKLNNHIQIFLIPHLIRTGTSSNTSYTCSASPPHFLPLLGFEATRTITVTTMTFPCQHSLIVMLTSLPIQAIIFHLCHQNSVLLVIPSKYTTIQLLSHPN